MRIVVMGLWHLGCVTAACLANRGFEVIGLDDSDKIEELNKGMPPIFEPGLEELIKRGMKNKNLSFTTDISVALSRAGVLWVTFDTPVDNNNNADVGYVMNKVREVFQHIEHKTVVIISSQIPVGTTRKLQKEFNEQYYSDVRFMYIPENLRLGNAIKSFMEPERVVFGVDNKDMVRHIVKESSDVIYMSIESAEMTKHALNAWLATSIVFANEVAELCESVGADYKDVERGLRTDPRVGIGAYIKAGNSYAGGTLARDVRFLQDISINNRVKDSVLFNAVEESNDDHKMWVLNKLRATSGINNKKIAVLGLAYKNGTDTLRGSASIDLCISLWVSGAKVICYDPLVKEIPVEYKDMVKLSPSAIEAIINADVVVIMNGCEEYKRDDIIEKMKKIIIIDPNRFLEGRMGYEKGMQYYAVGKGN